MKAIAKKIGVFPTVMFLFFIFSLALFLLALLSADVADFVSDNVGGFLRRILASLSSPLPFSLGEVVIYAIPIALIVVIILGVVAFRRGRKLRYICAILAIISYFISAYLLALCVGYHTHTLDERIGLSDEPVTAEELAQTARAVAAGMNETLDEIDFPESGSTVMPYDLDTLSEKIVEAYDETLSEVPFLRNFTSRAKRVASGETMTYMHLLGIYTYYTGESNVNTTYPDYNLPFTVAHEFAHQRGVTRENEANFVAFLVCSHATDPYIRYSGYLNMYEYLVNALYRADPALYVAVYKETDPRVRSERMAYADFHEKYEETKLGEISETVNDTYLKVNGTAGVASYGLVVDLCVAYYRDK